MECVDLTPLTWGAIFSRGASKGILSGGPGALTGGIAGAFIGAGLAGPGGAVIGGAVGGHLGGQFDFPSEGQLNYGEDEMLRDWYRDNGNEDSCNK